MTAAQAAGCRVSENCVRCLHGVPHPPLLAVYDPAVRDYVEATERVCMARWASANHNHGQGQVCGLPVVRTVGDVDVCEHHYERALVWREYDRKVEDIQEKIRELREARLTYAAELEQSAILEEQAHAERSVVYYIRRTSDGMIKIGSTAAFAKRMTTHRREHGEIQILLTHSGTAIDERRMHRKFEAYRIGRGEWFRPMKPLLRWICDERQIVRYRKTQGQDVVRLGDLRKLVIAAPSDPKWRGGKRV